MGLLYIGFVISFIILLITNIVFVLINIYLWVIGDHAIVTSGTNLIEILYYAPYFKWIVLSDVIWLGLGFLFALTRKKYKTDQYFYLDSKKISNPIITVIIPTYNEENNVEKVIKNFQLEKNVKHVLVIDNNSTDKTVEIAKQCGAIVITKEINKGFGDSCIVGLNEALKTDANIIALTECDGTYSSSDLQKMIPYLDDCEVVLGTRLIQVLIEKENQNGIFNTWGNYFIAKLIQLKYFSIQHMGVVSLTDVGCTFRCIRRDGLEKMIERITNDYDKKIDKNGWLIIPYLNMIAIEKDLKIVEVPITFKKRTGGASKSGAERKSKGLLYGLRFIWFVLKA